MKYLVVVFALCIAGAFAGLTDTQREKLRNHKATCIARTGVDETVINNIKKGMPVQFNEALNCFSACMLKEIGIMRQDGTIDEEVSRAKAPSDVPKEKVDQVINLCKAEVGSNDCETGGKVLACLLKTRAISIL